MQKIYLKMYGLKMDICTINQELYNTIKNTFSRNLMHPKVYITKILRIQKYMQVYAKV